MYDEKIEEIEMTEEENKAQLKQFEGDILKGLLTAAAFKEDEENIKSIEISRGGIVLFSFRVRPLSEEEYDLCREKNTKYVRNKQLGIQYPEKTNKARFRSQLIYQATVEEDREKVWNNKESWKVVGVLNGIDLIDKVLPAGKKNEVIDVIDRISGYAESVEEVIKN